MVGLHESQHRHIATTLVLSILPALKSPRLRRNGDGRQTISRVGMTHEGDTAERLVVLETLMSESTIYPPGQVIHAAAWLRVPLREAAGLSGLSPRLVLSPLHCPAPTAERNAVSGPASPR